MMVHVRKGRVAKIRRQDKATLRRERAVNDPKAEELLRALFGDEEGKQS